MSNAFERSIGPSAPPNGRPSLALRATVRLPSLSEEDDGEEEWSEDEGSLAAACLDMAGFSAAGWVLAGGSWQRSMTPAAAALVLTACMYLSALACWGCSAVSGGS